ncbi:MAG: DUF3253 domain-containing protein [Kaiparowitsia implicata GSE-PSE-MK54-09C]|nr:DUF3253 domain-containing protein [Kaiparowitsia implicata GSE-PSE-MK54-09C]
MLDSDTIRRAILQKVGDRGYGKSICPSEVARELGGENWRSLMPTIRQIAASLAESGDILATQRGNPVHPLTAIGPIRLTLPIMRQVSEED